MIHMAISTSAEPNAYVTIIDNSSCKSLQELVAQAHTFYKEEMAAKDPTCEMCKRFTKYRCIKCKLAICNLCCEPELDKNVHGWMSLWIELTH